MNCTPSRKPPTPIKMRVSILLRPKWVQTFADAFKTDLVLIRKSRSFQSVKVHEVIGDVVGKTIVIYDDMTRTGGSLINAADAYLERGAVAVYAALSHLALASESVVQKLIDSKIIKIVCTNSHPSVEWASVKQSDKFLVMNCTKTFADCVLKLVIQ
mmetsp:Transcript_37758/g.61177  ORF Transcript_37758/g.61177 Transcript_37758/m.61177 type:complete len:157 (+) Transcript_37758:92-562(+)